MITGKMIRRLPIQFLGFNYNWRVLLSNCTTPSSSLMPHAHPGYPILPVQLVANSLKVLVLCATVSC